MIPILYNADETAFENFGVGHLTDAISPHVVEERNGEFTFEMQYPIFGEHYEELKLRSIILAKPSPAQVPQGFRIFRISKPINGIVTAEARHLRYDLEGFPVTPFSANGVVNALAAIKSHAMVSHNFTFSTNKTNAQSMTLTAPASTLSLLGGVQGSLLDIYGGEYKYDNFEVKLLRQRGADNGVVIRYGVDLLDLTQEENCAKVYTGVMCFWKSMQDGTLVTGEVQSAGTFDYCRINVIDLSAEYENAPSVAQLNQKAVDYINNNAVGVPRVSINLKFANLEQTEEYSNIRQSVELCDQITVEFVKLGVSAMARIIRTDYDVMNEKYISVDIGDSRTSLADSFVSVQTKAESAPTATEMQQAITATTAAITGAEGGAVRLLDTNNDGLPDTLYIADDPSPLLAQKVWRFNYEGWGASQNGYSGPFTMGATFQQGFIADFITAGTLNADRIGANSIAVSKLTGSISGGLNDSWEIDLDNGAITIGNISANNITAGTLNVDRIASNSVGIGKLTGSISNNDWTIDLTNGTLTIGNISADNINAGTLNVDRIGANSVGLSKLTGSITQDGWAIDLTNGTLTIGNISANNITSGTIDASTITVTNLNADNITTGSINGSRIIDSTISGAKIGDLEISGSKLANSTITGTKIGDLEITGGKLADSTITGGKIGDLEITGAKVADTTLPGGKLQNNTLGDLQMGVGSLSTVSLSGGINTSLGHADMFGAATAQTATTYPAYFTCGTLIAKTGVSSNGNIIATGSVQGATIKGNTISVYYGSASTGQYYDIGNHTHDFEEGPNGTIVIKKADWTGAAHSFRIADTQAYQDAVSAVTVKSYGFEQDENQETDYTSLYVVLGLNGTTTNTVGNLDISGSYNAGQNAGARTATISAVTIGATGAPSYSSEDQAWYATAAVAGTSRGTLADGTYYTNANAYSRNVAIDVTSTYNAGKDAGAQTAYVSAITTGVAGSPSWSSEDSVYYANVSVTATARGTKSDGTYYTADRTITKAVDVTAVYEAGQTSGAANVTLTLTDSQTGFNSNTHKKTVTVDAVVANASGTTVRTGSKDVEVDATSVYNSGQNAGAQTAYFSAVSAGSAGTPSWNAEDQVYYANVSITGTARGTKADGSYYTDSRSITCAVDVSAVYAAGQASGASNVTLTLTDSQSGFDSTTHKKNVTVNAVVADSGGTTVQTGSKVVEVDATSVYNAGVTSGAQTAYVSSITGGTAGAPSWNSEDQAWYATVPVSATARGTYADGTYYTNPRTGNTSVDVTAVYNAGKTAGQGEGASGVTATVTMSGAQVPSVADNATITATATLSNSNTASGSYAIYIETAANTSSAVTMQVAHGSGSSKVVLASKTVTPVHEAETATITMTGAQASSSTYTGTITALATLSGGGTATETYGIYIETVTNSTSEVTMQVAHGSGTSKVILASRTVTPASVGISGVSVLATSASNYTTYDRSINIGSSSIYASGSLQYGRTTITLDNGTTAVLRVSMPYNSAASVSSIAVSRISGTSSDWTFPSNNDVCVGVNLVAKDASDNALYSTTGAVNVNDVVNFLAPASGSVLATDSSNYGTYNYTGYIQNYLYTSGNYSYGRMAIKNSAGNTLFTVRVQLDASGSSSGTITITNEATSSSVNPYYGTLPYYAYINNRHYVYVSATSTGVANRTQYIDINDIVNYAYELGGGGAPSYNSVSLYCVKRTENYAGLVTCDFSVSSYNGLFWRQGYYYTFYYN